MVEVREHFGVKFSVVPQGLSEEEVLDFVNGLIEKTGSGQSADQRQASLLKLAEQMVLEADKLADGIKEQARQEAQEEGARLVSASKQTAEEQSQRLLERAKREASEQTSEIVVGAERDSREIIEKAHTEALSIIQVARDKLASVEAEAKLQAEYVVRRFTARFVEELRSAVTDTSNNMLPGLDHLMKESGYGHVLEEEPDSKAVIASGKGKARSSAKR